MATSPVQIARLAHGETDGLATPVAQLAPALAVRAFELWHLLSLDAPCVAVSWLLLFEREARPHGVASPAIWPEALALWIAVWMIYVLDRLLDARTGVDCLQERHRFHWRARGRLGLLLIPAAAALVALVPRLPAGVALTWPLLAVPLLAYAGLVHLAPAHPVSVPRLPKPLVTAVFFAFTVALPAWQRAARTGLLPSVLLFAGICWLNGALIEAWESPPRLSARSARMIHWNAALLLGTAVALAVLQSSSVAASVALGTLLLLCLNRRSHQFKALHLRALADVTLLTPLLTLLLVH